MEIEHLVIHHKWKGLVIVPDNNRGAKVVTTRFNICIFLKFRKYILFCVKFFLNIASKINIIYLISL